jgi:tetratricopeptide (TPR) repeat protein
VPAEQSDGLAQLAETYQALGKRQNALDSLQRALKLAEQTGDQARIAAMMGSLGNAYLLGGATDKARHYLNEGLAKAREIKNTAVAAAILNNLGNLLSARQYYPEARAAFEESYQLAKQTGNHGLVTKALSNAARVALQTGDYGKTGALLGAARAIVSKIHPSHFKAYALMDLGQLARRLQAPTPADPARWRLFAYQAFKEAADIAKNLGDRRAASYTLGYLGQLYEDERHYAEALDLTRRAVFAAQAIQAPESLYLWQWQTGRLLKAQQQKTEAILAYRQAVHTLESLRQDLSLAYRGGLSSFREAVESLYLELADLLLQYSESLRDQEKIQSYLSEAREMVELLKATELRDYFQDECVTVLQARIARLDRLAPHTAVLYPIPFPTAPSYC